MVSLSLTSSCRLGCANLWSLLGPLKTSPKRDYSFDNHPCWVAAVAVLGADRLAILLGSQEPTV